MNQKLSRLLTAFIVLLMSSYSLPYCLSEDYDPSYQLLDNPEGSMYYSLNAAISQSLYEYYCDKSHRLGSNYDFAKFVTPYALQPIADSLWEIYTSEEDFANGVLMIVHQIPYSETLPTKYPVETIVTNKGDCDLFSYIAASIMDAGGLDVVLLYYEDESHMNVGVHLQNTPQDVRGQAFHVTYSNIQYYVCECTGGDWRTGWRVGECPEDLRHASPQVITLENCELWAPGQVSASYETLASSTISLTISSKAVIQGSTITCSGWLSPALPDRAVTIYIRTNNLPWAVLDVVTTGSNGQFVYVWNTEITGICYIRASWSGDSDYAGADSQISNVMVFSMFFILLLAVAVVLVCVGTLVFLLSRRSQQEILPPQPPEIPQ